MNACDIYVGVWVREVWVNGTTDGDKLYSAAQTVRIQSIYKWCQLEFLV